MAYDNMSPMKLLVLHSCFTFILGGCALAQTEVSVANGRPDQVPNIELRCTQTPSEELKAFVQRASRPPNAAKIVGYAEAPNRYLVLISKTQDSLIVSLKQVQPHTYISTNARFETSKGWFLAQDVGEDDQKNNQALKAARTEQKPQAWGDILEYCLRMANAGEIKKFTFYDQQYHVEVTLEISPLPQN
jgi:hypothetical protein